MKKLRVLEAFAGIGSQTQALKNIGVPHEVVAISEIDKFAIKAYETIHGKVNNLGDVSKIKTEDIPDFDLLTYSFPCTDISIAGKKLGFSKDSNTRSGLLWECEKIIKTKKPKYLLMENVKALLSSTFIDGFQEWVKLLDSYGYKTTYAVLNSKDYGVPQNRERVFAVSVLQDDELAYKFPKGFMLETQLRDFLDSSVPERYFYDNERTQKLLKTLIESGRLDKIVDTDKIENLGNLIPEAKFNNTQGGRVYGVNGIAPTLTTGSGDRVPKIVDEIDFIVGSTQKNAMIGNGELAPTLTSSMGTGGGHTPMISRSKRIRKLTPRECWRLMGFPDKQFDKTQVLDEKGKPVISNTQLYKQAGNSIVVDVLENIFYTMFENTEYKPKNLPLRREKMDYIQGDRFGNDSFELFSLIK